MTSEHKTKQQHQKQFMNHSDNNTLPITERTAEHTDQSPSSSTQTTPLGSKVTALKSVESNKTGSKRKRPMSPIRRTPKERVEVQTAHSNNRL